jgi:CRP-like cAMP-binding protein/membrane protease YdiL (CAAX protease family)
MGLKMNNNKLLERIHELFEGNTPDDILTLMNESFIKKTFDSGETILKDKEKAEHCYFILSGSISIKKNQTEICQIRENNFIGLMGIKKNNKQRNATIICNNPVTAYVIPYTFVQYIKEYHPSAHLRLMEIETEHISIYLEQANQRVHEENEKTRSAMNFFSATVFLTLLMLIFLSISSNFKEDFLSTAEYRILASNIMVLMYTVVFSIMIYRSSFKLRFYGITLQHWKKDLALSSIFTLFFLLLVLVAKFCYIKITKNHQMHIFDLPVANSPVSSTFFVILIYAILTALQEFVSRGVIQGVTMELARTRYEKIRAIIIVTMLFCCSHLHFPNDAIAILVVFPSLFWSLLYELTERRLLSVVFSHSIIGVFFFTIIGWHGILGN